MAKRRDAPDSYIVGSGDPVDWKRFMKRYKRYDEMSKEERAELLRRIVDEGKRYDVKRD